MTTLAEPRAERPAVRAKGTVNPSERPIVALETMRGSRWRECEDDNDGDVDCEEVELFSVNSSWELKLLEEEVDPLSRSGLVGDRGICRYVFVFVLGLKEKRSKIALLSSVRAMMTQILRDIKHKKRRLII